MPTQDQVVSISLSKGIDTKTDLKQGINGRLLVLENAVFTGVTDIEKRNGYASISNSILGGGSISNGNSIGLFNNSIITTFDGTNAYSYSPNESTNVNIGVKLANSLTTNSLSGSVSTYFWPTETTNGTIKFVAYPTNPTQAVEHTVSYNYFDVSNDDALSLSVPQNIIATGSNQVFNVDSTTFSGDFVLAIGQATNVQMVHLPQIPSLSPTTFGNITTNGLAPYMTSTSTGLYIMTYDGTNFKVSQYDLTFALINTYTLSLTTSGDVFHIYMIYDSINNEFIAGATYSSGAIVNRYDSNFTLLSNISTVSDANIINQFFFPRLTFSTDGTNLELFYDTQTNNIGANSNYITCIPYLNYRTSVTSPGPLTLGVNTKLYSKSFYYSGRFFVGLIYFSSPNVTSAQVAATQSGIYILATDISNNYTIPTRIAYGNTYSPTNALTVLYGNLSIQSKSALVSWSSTYILPFFNTIQESLVTVISGSQTGVILPVFTVNDGKITFNSKLNNLSLGKNLNISGSSGSLYDGLGIAEQGFNSFPVISGGFTSNVGTGFSYSYLAVYVWYDFQGNLHRSATSIPAVAASSAAVGGGNPSVVVVTGLGLAEPYKLPNVQVQIYRTSSNAGIYYLLTTLNNTDTGLITYSDVIPDSDIIGNTQVYITGGEVDNIPPPPYDISTEFKNREIVVSTQDSLQWWYSKQVIEGFPVEFSDLFTQNIDQKGGPITALSTMDDKLVFFKQSNVWYVTGDGPAPNGSLNDFSYPQIISSDTGCNNQDSIVLTPKGLLFQSPKGIYLLDRGLGMNYIGAPVESYNIYTISSAQMIAGTTQVRFTLLGIDTTLIYDYYVDQWSVFRNINAVDSIIYNGLFTFLTAAGIVNVETPGTYLDNGAIIPMNFTTGWMKLSDIQGFERLKKLLIIGYSSGPSTINTSFNYDYDTKNTMPITAIPVSGQVTRMQYRTFPPRQKGEAFQLVYTETPAAGSAGVTQVSNLALEIGMKKGPYKLPASNSYG